MSQRPLKIEACKQHMKLFDPPCRNTEICPPWKSCLECEWRVCVSSTDALVCFFCLFGQRFLSNPPADSRHILHAGVAWVGTCLLPFWGLAAPGGRKKRQMKFSLVWESMGNFCILAVFERYLSNACTNPHQILFVYGQCLPTCPLPCAHSGIEPSTLAKGFLQGGPKIRFFDHF